MFYFNFRKVKMLSCKNVNGKLLPMKVVMFGWFGGKHLLPNIIDCLISYCFFYTFDNNKYLHSTNITKLILIIIFLQFK